MHVISLDDAQCRIIALEQSQDGQEEQVMVSVVVGYGKFPELVVLYSNLPELVVLYGNLPELVAIYMAISLNL